MRLHRSWLAPLTARPLATGAYVPATKGATAQAATDRSEESAASIMRSLRVMTVFAACVHASACFALSGGPVRGHVLEEGSGRPISGAIVVVRWSGVAGTMGHGGGVCYHVETTTTKGDGSYDVPQWHDPEDRGGTGMSHQRYHVTAFKQGYVGSGHLPRSDETVYLTPFSGGSKARLDYLAGFGGMQCGDWNNYSKQLVPLYEAIYEEASRIATSRQERESAILNLRDLEEMRFGHEAAYRNWRKRRELLQ